MDNLEAYKEMQCNIIITMQQLNVLARGSGHYM